MLSTLNPHPRDANIIFEETGHKYTIKGLDGHPVSTTTLIHVFFNPFVAAIVAEQCIQNSASEYFFKVDPNMKDEKQIAEAREKWKQSVIDEWENSSKLGTAMHADIENYFNGLIVKNPDSVEFKYFMLFWNEFQRTNPGWKPYRTEWLIYDEDKKLAGSVDFTIVNQNGDLVIMDWKRSKKIRKTGFNKWGKAPFTDLPDCNYSHYTLQLNIYRHVLETRYGKRVLAMYLAIFYPGNKCYEVHMVNRYPIDKVWDQMFINYAALHKEEHE